jgi:hypothetical protein
MRGRPLRPLRLAGAGSAALAVVWVAGAAGQTPDQLHINVEPIVVAAPKSEVAFPIRITAPEALPKKGFLNVLGLPPGVSLTEGHPLSPGSWAVPFAVASTLKVSIPEGVIGRSEIVIRLIALDGRMLAQTQTALVVEPSVTGGAAAPTSPASDVVAAPAPLTGAPPESRPARPVPPSAAPLSEEEKERGQRALAQGEEYFARGSILVARQYFQHAAESGLAQGALRLAATYDPGELQHIQAAGVVADRDLARKWYERARELGAVEAEERLARLDGR